MIIGGLWVLFVYLFMSVFTTKLPLLQRLNLLSRDEYYLGILLFPAILLL